VIDARRHAAATRRNREAIAHVLQDSLPVTGTVLEVASGSGEHVAHFAAEFPGHRWQPSDPDPAARASITAWCAGLANVAPPLDLDASARAWPIERADAVLCINMVHISPWPATLGLLAGAAHLLPEGGALILYGPYRRDGVTTAESNEAFDADLKARNADWGLRTVEAVTTAGQAVGLRFDRLVPMPANNLSLVYRRE
jgi:SAM-dependent methyltransferase